MKLASALVDFTSDALTAPSYQLNNDVNGSRNLFGYLWDCQGPSGTDY
jgi:hypothetical protein